MGEEPETQKVNSLNIVASKWKGKMLKEPSMNKAFICDPFGGG
jgi:hypothetical protein